MLKVGIYEAKKSRSRTLCAAMAEGIKAVGDRPFRYMEGQYKEPAHLVAVFYGLGGNLRKILADHSGNGRSAVFIDLGFWGRKDGGRHGGYHKISVNARHPTAYFQNRKHPSDRVARFNLQIRPWRKSGRYILLAGMSVKSSWVDGMAPAQWEKEAVQAIKAVTDRPIIYRPKPSCLESRPIPGTTFSPRTQTAEQVLRDCHAVVTHHSNVAVDGLLLGVPAFCWFGVAQPMSLQDFSRLDDPLFPEDRQQWISDIAYTQWSVAEMASGALWRHLKNEGLVP